MLNVTPLSPGRTGEIVDYLEVRDPDKTAARRIDNYLQKDSVGVGELFGPLAARLGQSEYNSDAVASLIEGKDPRTGELLVELRPGFEHDPGWDLTFSPPKSLTTLAHISEEKFKKIILQS